MAQVKAHHGGMKTRFGGNFNEGTVMSFQNFAKLPSSVDHYESYDFLPPKRSFADGLREGFNSNKVKGELYPRVSSQLDKIVDVLDMGSIDLSSGGFRSRLVDAAIENAGDMVAFEMPITVDMNYVPHHSDFEKNPVSLRDSYKRLLGVEIPAAIKTSIYFVVPKDKMRAVMQMVDALALQSERNAGAFKSTASLGLHEYLAYQTLNDEQKALLEHAPKAVAWFELKEHFVMTLDEDIHQKFAKAFGASGLDDKKLRSVYDEQMSTRRASGVLGWPNK